MGDEYRRYNVAPEKRQVFNGFLQKEASALNSPPSLRHYGQHSSSTDPLDREVLASRYGAYGTDGSTSIGVRSEPDTGRVSTVSSMRGYPPLLEDKSLIGQRRDGSVNISPSIGVRAEPDIGGVSTVSSLRGYPSLLEDKLRVQRGDASLNISQSNPEMMCARPNALQKADDPSIPASTAERESNILFVDGLPRDCTRREVGHLFRPFIGFKDIKVVHKEPRRSGDKAIVLCFVEFIDAQCALTALEALQGYNFDDKKPDSSTLKISFAHFPFELPSSHDNQHRRMSR